MRKTLPPSATASSFGPGAAAMFRSSSSSTADEVCFSVAYEQDIEGEEKSDGETGIDDRLCDAGGNSEGEPPQQETRLLTWSDFGV